METKDLSVIPKQRMYHITSFYLAGIHSGIQSYHAGMRYALKFWDTPEFQRWANSDQTIIVLAGGDTNSMMNEYYSNEHYVGGMQKALEALYNNKIKYEVFYEPGVNNAMTSIALLVPEHVWDKETYPDPFFNKSLDVETAQAVYVADLEALIGKENAFLREFLKPFGLAK